MRGGPLVVVFHGVNRNAEDYRNFAIAVAERLGYAWRALRYGPQWRACLEEALVTLRRSAK